MNDTYKAISKRRSIRRFDILKEVDINNLYEMVELGALAPNRLNMQPWEFIVINKPNVRDLLFENILWGVKNPSNRVFADPQYSPTAYIAVIINKGIRDVGYEYEIGACIQNMLIYATSLNLGTVWIHSLNRARLSQVLELPEGRMIDSLIAVGYPAHKSTVVEMEDDKYSYSTDKDCNLVVPKRDLTSILFYNKYGHSQRA